MKYFAYSESEEKFVLIFFFSPHLAVEAEARQCGKEREEPGAALSK